MMVRSATEGPDAAAPAVLDGGLILPPPVAVHTITRAAIRGLGGQREIERHLMQTPGRRRIGFPVHHHDQAGIVVGAVAVLEARMRPVGVFEQPLGVGHRLEVGQ